MTPKEFELLSLLARNHDRVLTHRAILKAIWGPNAVEQTEHLWTLVAQLRKKIEPDPATPQYILSEPWVGYRFATARPSAGQADPRPATIPALPALQDFLRNFSARSQAGPGYPVESRVGSFRRTRCPVLDLLFVGLSILFFAVSIGYVAACRPAE